LLSFGYALKQSVCVRKIVVFPLNYAAYFFRYALYCCSLAEYKPALSVPEVQYVETAFVPGVGERK
ncbi:hypothetical protein, partial [Acinetobacter baumannii]|uniref:hypothetical protein n=1 Tax=Acinetobacter baumannii TaxID=470 RepID=UPI003330150D